MALAAMTAINAFCVVFSAYHAMKAFVRNDAKMGWFNLFASAFNLGIVLHYIFA